MNNHEQWDDHDPDLPDDAGQPDFNALREDEAFIDALARDMPVLTGDDAEYRLAVLLSGYVATPCQEPLPPLPGIDEIEHAIAASEPPRRGSRAMRHLRAVSVPPPSRSSRPPGSSSSPKAPSPVTPCGESSRWSSPSRPSRPRRWCRPRTTWSKPSRPFRQATCHRPTA